VPLRTMPVGRGPAPRPIPESPGRNSSPVLFPTNDNPPPAYIESGVVEWGMEIVKHLRIKTKKLRRPISHTWWRNIAFITILAFQALALSGCGALGGTAEPPTLTDTNPSALLPNVAGMIESGTTTGANSELSALQIAARAYAAENPGVLRFTSDELAPMYVTTKPRAKYYFNTATGLITRVDSISGGWPAIAFRLSDQKWVKGTPDNNHASDQDIP
jgi:hypothetical protein